MGQALSEAEARDAPGDTASVRDRLGQMLPGDRVALWVFVVYLVVSLFVLTLVIGDFHWFTLDEWDFLADRTAGDVNDVFRPHNEHWVTIPVLVYRVLWNLFGLHSYLPYQLVSVSVHLAVAGLARSVMRRSGVSGWMATCAAAPLVLFGPGGQNILWAFQITFTGALAFGLVHLLLADHDGPFDWRDWLGLASGLAALMCSNVGIAMAVMVGMATLFRRGWRLALLHTVPLAGAFAVWWLIFRPPVSTAHLGRPTLGQLVAFVRTGEIEGVKAIGHFPVIGWLLIGVLLVGAVIALRTLDRDALRRSASAPLALFLGGVVFFLTAGYVRATFGGAEALGHRYVYVAAVTLLPAIALGADQVARRWRPLAPVLMALFLVGLPWNIQAFETSIPAPEVFALQRQWTLLLPTMDGASEVPRSVRPDPGGFGSPGLTVGWLVDAHADGQLPEPGQVPSPVFEQTRVRLGVVQLEEPAEGACVERVERIVLEPRKGDSIGIRSPVEVVLVDEAQGPVALPLWFIPRDGERLTILVDGLRLRLGAVFPNHTYTLCL